MVSEAPRTPPWTLVWVALGLHVAGMTVDANFHAAEDRPYDAFEMLWPHALSYLGAALAVYAGRRAARLEPLRGTGRIVALCGLVQVLALATDFVTEISDVRESLSAAVYLVSLTALAVLAVNGQIAWRRRVPA